MSSEIIVCKKVSFADEEQANFYIDKLNKTSKRVVVPQRAYLCNKCLNWHLTSKEENKTYFSVVTENENLKKELEDKNKQIANLLISSKSKDTTEKDRVLKERGDKITELNNRVSKLESMLKKKDKTMNAIAKLILDSMNLK